MEPLVYFDNGALKTASGYRCNLYYQEINANIHRGVHTLSQWLQMHTKFHVVKSKSP
jgi:selenocysteine lyase/cysteine desulfurase